MRNSQAVHFTTDQPALQSLLQFPGDSECGANLVLASNRTNEDRELKVKLDMNTLGLAGRHQVRHFDTGHTPAPGEDLQTTATREAEV